MSRIHEALLKAQQEQTFQIGDIRASQPETSGWEFQTSDTGTAVAAAPFASIEEVTVRKNPCESFAQHSWHLNEELLVFANPKSTVAIEEFRLLRSKLFRERSQRHLKTILISGASPGEGKTFVATNLAMGMACHGDSRVLLIDADLRRSTLHTLLGMKAEPGLSDYLTGQVEETAIVRQTPESQLCVVTSGTPGHAPTELLQSRRMQQFINSMVDRFDWILLDSPPAAAVSDSVVLSELSDGIVLVIAPGTPIEVAQRARQEFSHKLILGAVLNRAGKGMHSYEYYATKPNPRRTI